MQFGGKLPDVKLPTGHPCVDSLQPRKPARRVEMMLDRLKVGLVLYPTQGISSSAERTRVIKGTKSEEEYHYLIMLGNLTTGPLVMPS